METASESCLLDRAPWVDARRPSRSPAPVPAPGESSARLVRIFRAGYRLGWFIATLLVAALDFAGRLWLGGRQHDRRARCEWTSRWARALLRCVNVRAEYAGEPPLAGLLVCNHLSYLDIVVLAARHPAVFVSKAEVRDWPGIGWLTRMAGTLFVRRERRGDVSPLNDQIMALVRAGVVVIVFPEGTSSDGRTVQPFYSSLLEPASASGCGVTPAFIRYELVDGVVADEVCYWRDMTFGPHLLNLLTKREIRAVVRFGAGRPAVGDRKRLARELRQAVCELGGI